MLKFIPKPYIPERAKYAVSQHIFADDRQVMTFSWDGKPHWMSATFGDATAQLPVEFCAGLNWYDLDDPQHLLATPMPGDWVIRSDTPREKVLAGVADRLSARLGRDIHFERQTQDRDVIVVAGRFDASRIKQLPGGALVVGTAPPAGPRQLKPSRGTLKEILGQFGQTVRTRVIDQATNSNVTIAWWDFDVKRNDLDREMDALAAQTGLTFRTESRKAEIWTLAAGPARGS